MLECPHWGMVAWCVKTMDISFSQEFLSRRHAFDCFASWAALFCGIQLDPCSGLWRESHDDGKFNPISLSLLAKSARLCSLVTAHYR